MTVTQTRKSAQPLADTTTCTVCPVEHETNEGTPVGCDPDATACPTAHDDHMRWCTSPRCLNGYHD